VTLNNINNARSYEQTKYKEKQKSWQRFAYLIPSAELKVLQKRVQK